MSVRLNPKCVCWAPIWEYLWNMISQDYTDDRWRKRPTWYTLYLCEKHDKKGISIEEEYYCRSCSQSHRDGWYCPYCGSDSCEFIKEINIWNESFRIV